MPPRKHTLELEEATDADGRPLLIAAGDVDLETAPKLRNLIEAAGEDGGDVVLDLRDVRFMDSPGLGTLIYCYQRQADHGGRLVVRRPQGHVRELFEIVGLAHILSD
jgi:anti-sigma B factor antagonist